MVEYSAKSLYDVIRVNLLLKDKDLVRFINVTNDTILEEYKKIKKTPNISLNEIFNKYENYTIVYMNVNTIIEESKIYPPQSHIREITNLLLDDELTQKLNYDND